jgi:glycosyltransferase involved in cell wall biosynthesis
MIMASRLIPLKFADDGVKAMIEAARIDSRASGIVAGSGPLRPELEAMVAEAGMTSRIRFAGHLSQQQLSVLLPHCVTLSPLTGMALVESGLGGSPVVAYDVDWQPEFVEDGVNGFIVPTRDWREMGRKAAQLVGNEELRKQMGEAMRASAISRADRAVIAAQESAIFATLLDGRPMEAEWQ